MKSELDYIKKLEGALRSSAIESDVKKFVSDAKYTIQTQTKKFILEQIHGTDISKTQKKKLDNFLMNKRSTISNILLIESKTFMSKTDYEGTNKKYTDDLTINNNESISLNNSNNEKNVTMITTLLLML